MSRLNNFYKLESHPMLGKDFKKLSKMELADCLSFLKETESLGKNDYCEKVNRWKLDRPDLRTKNHTIMWALLLQSE